MNDSTPSRARVVAFAVFVSAVVVAIAVYLFVVSEPRPASPERSTRIVDDETSRALVEIRRGSHVAFRNMAPGAMYGLLTFAPLNPGAARVSTGLPCHRIHFGDTVGICLAVTTTPAGFLGYLLDDSLRVTHAVDLPGLPSRTRVSRNSALAAYTVFVAGDSYLASGLSTRTRLVDPRTAATVADLEALPVTRNGRPFRAVDFNFWGVTFTRDARRFYATLGTGGRILLVQGDVAAREMRVIAEDIECPSLSPDERHIAFKKRFGSTLDAWWQPAVLDLATKDVRLLPEPKHIDDQIEWLDDGHILYAVGHSPSAVQRRSDVWQIAIDGATPPAVFLADAESPAVVRR